MKHILSLFCILALTTFGFNAYDVQITQRNAANTAFGSVYIAASGAITNVATFRSTLGIPGLTTANTFTALQTINLNGTVVTPPANTMLHLIQTDGSQPWELLDGFGADVVPRYIGRRSSGTAASPTAVLFGKTLVSVEDRGYATTGYTTTPRGWFRIVTSENWTDTAQGAYLEWSDTLTGGVVASTGMNMREGNLLIGGTSLTGLTGQGGLKPFGVFYPQGVIIQPMTAMGALAVDVTKPVNTYSGNGPQTFTYSGTPTDGTWVEWRLTASGGTLTPTIPSTWSLTRGGTITDLGTIASGSTLDVKLRYVTSPSARWEVIGDPPATIGTGSYVLSSETVHSITFAISGGGSTLTTGIQDIVVCPRYGGTISGWSITTSASDAITFDILRSASGGAVPTSSIVGAGTKPTQASGVSTVSTTLTSWTSTTVTANDNFRIQITSAPATSTAATFTLYYQ
jgi:hypothetical protein